VSRGARILLVLQLMPRIRWRPLVVAAELIEPIQ
jgi:hypothetical protein